MGLEIEVDKLAAHLVELDGSSFDVHFFLHQVGPHALRHESVGDRLNDPESRFLPCEIDGFTWLVRVAGIAYVRFDEPPPELALLEEVGALRARVDLLLRSGEHLRGELVYEARSPSGRVSDFLNADPQRFLLVHTRQGVFYVHRDAVSRIRV